jgi:hypothetical protein
VKGKIVLDPTGSNSPILWEIRYFESHEIKSGKWSFLEETSIK